MSDIQKKHILSPTTLVPLGIVVTCCVSVIIAVLKFHGWISGQFASLSAEIKDLKDVTQHMNGNRWTAQDQEIFSLRLKLNNNSLVIPDIGEIVKRREQNSGRP